MTARLVAPPPLIMTLRNTLGLFEHANQQLHADIARQQRTVDALNAAVLKLTGHPITPLHVQMLGRGERPANTVDAARWAKLREAFEGMTTSMSEQFLVALGIQDDTCSSLDDLFDAKEKGRE